ncbi:MAG: sigma-54-dependent Fis family transcriptional regulator [Myxococcales bacterium]|nr:sigma-54-dependent Fis family transcriptional regulator [Myxococcales bacterium]
MASRSLELARLLLEKEDDVAAAGAFLERVLALTGADRGFVVVRDEGQFVPKFEIQIDAGGRDDRAIFSRALVKQAIGSDQVIHSTNPAEDPALSHTESVMAAKGRAVLVVPLSSRGVCYGALYIEHPEAAGISAESRAAVTEVAEIAGLVLRRAVERAGLERRSRQLEDDLLAKHDFAGILTRDPVMLDVLRTLVQVADSNAAILISGETGTGKELVAKAVHVNSSRKDRPFVTVHCAALPSSLIESELFGHVRGAFSGADRDRAGRLATAHQGTLFLDEIAELPLDVQAKLLRAVQFGELSRLGTDKIEKVDVRIVAATHRDLVAMVEKGTFRQDLYYRLRVVELELPPLRDRGSDIAILAEHFRAHHERGREKRLTAGAISALERYRFPGNVRELAHAIERACLVTPGVEIEPSALPREIAAAAATPERVAAFAGEPTFGEHDFGAFGKDDLERVQTETNAQVERRFLLGLMQRWGGNVSRAARESGIHRSHLHKLLARHQIESGS